MVRNKLGRLQKGNYIGRYLILSGIQDIRRERGIDIKRNRKNGNIETETSKKKLNSTVEMHTRPRVTGDS